MQYVEGKALGWRQNGAKKARGKTENGRQGMLKIGPEPQGIRGWLTEVFDWDRGGLEKAREKTENGRPGTQKNGPERQGMLM